ncbi:VOC family protein [Metabacillus sp. GX 13764]|uniref:SMU1112c/YaeR family gloxylase I-like metalloprotein n=1 Tax=Metabacillus kandeliae TaxID=2900151 RepID=UPI001E3AB028|nr:VOC family protein [Metabacillus kandeliae]MCD7034683.1 VOC family protein [Metabacillus kandeliae]
MLNRIHHAAIICSDYKVSKTFYTETLGLEIEAETYREERNSYKLDLKVGDTYQIELFSFQNPPERPNQPEARGLRHLAFEVDSLKEAVKILNERGVETEPVRVDELTGKAYTFFKDPDGLPLELYER